MTSLPPVIKITDVKTNTPPVIKINGKIFKLK